MQAEIEMKCLCFKNIPKKKSKLVGLAAVLGRWTLQEAVDTYFVPGAISLMPDQITDKTLPIKCSVLAPQPRSLHSLQVPDSEEPEEL